MTLQKFLETIQLIFYNAMSSLLLLIIFYIAQYLSLTTKEISFICHFDGIQGFPVNCSDAINACNYTGITCNQNLSITGLQLTLCGGDDIIPASIGDLHFLNSLSINSNCNIKPQGKIPIEIGNCNLTLFQINNCNIRGSIPSELFNNRYLQSLTFNGNNLTGTVPSELSLLTSLRVIYFENNNLLSGTFPNIENLTKLTYFGLRSTHFTGLIPYPTNCNNLYTYDISGNDFYGNIPLFNSTYLNLIDLSNNNINNVIPDNLLISPIKYKLIIKIKSSGLIGTLPDNLLKIGVVVLDLSYNFISGTIPSVLVTSGSLLQQLILTRNRISGTLPTELNNFAFPDLFKFDIAHNSLTGMIPSFSLRSINRLIFPMLFKGYIYLDLNDNLLSGVIPTFGNFTAQTSIDLSNNKLSLDESSFGVSTNISWLNLAGNNIVTLPSLFSDKIRFKELVMLDLSNCQITGLIPQMFHVQYLKLNNNFLIGDVNPLLIDPSYTIRPVFVDLILNRLRIDAERNTSFGVSSVYGSANSETVINIYPQDVDECSLNISQCEHFCLDGWFPVPGYTCGCQSGFKLNSDKRNCDVVCGDGILKYPQEECDFVYSPFGCNTNCTVKPGYHCDLKGCSPICGDQIVVPEEECDGSIIGCTNDCKVKSGYTCSNNICQLCAPEKWEPFPFVDNFQLFPKFRSLGYNISTFAFSSCLLCSGGLAIQTRNVINSIYCTGLESKEAVPCSFACSNLSVFTSAKESLYTLQQQLEKGNFLNSIFNTLFNTNVTIESKDGQLYFELSSCDNVDKFTNIIQALTFDIVPNIPSLIIKSDNCTISLSSTDPIIFSFPIGAIVGIAIFVILLLLILIVVYYYLQSELHQLPKEVSWSFFDKITHPWRWTYHEGYYSRKYEVDSKEFERVDSLLATSFKKGSLKISKITAIYNQSLTISFINYWKIMITRKIQSADQFFVNTYSKNQEKVKVMEYFNNNVADSNIVPLVPVLHGTDLNIAKKIAATGFASLSSLDAGFYGKGIYFTTHLLYTLPYCGAKRNPAVIISYLNMGNIYPVTEDHRGAKTLLGSALKSGYNSHYVLTNKDGNIYDEGVVCDEIVVNQESQILPAFIISLDPESCIKAFDNWSRVIVESTPKDIIIEINDDYIRMI
jgi:hypothetical protein